MCSPFHAQPPDPTADSHRPAGERVVLTSADGAEFAAYNASAPEPCGSAAVVLPDVRGLSPFYETLAESLAGCGIDSVAIDYFGRTAGGSVPRPSDFDFMPHVLQTTPDQVRDDVSAALEHLRANTGAGRTYTIGFCFGGSHSFNLAWRGMGLAGVVGFYGPPRDERPARPSPIEHAAEFGCPVLGLFGGADEGIPLTDVREFDDALDKAGVAHEIKVYEDAPHSFFDRGFEEHREACEDAWRRVLSFMGAR